ncbi:hypothetical protein GCM10008090_32640 [Arenicella chitinivorans]|uniref:Uncharacterized protein n=1 Tax=Arenicella chitinivorans TaxID=1329800 RepID=A0A918VSB7_9GAMM|nr:hypothetical protein [Arenicella chitinivorans]GHA20187.1 hypothetical protein GCM10008090_32640 [Arenicella chitinivorans]
MNNTLNESTSPLPTEASPSMLEKFKQLCTVTQLMRIGGACAVMLSMSLFMLKGWSEGNDLSRYLKLLAQTGLLTGVGLALTFIVKETKGARVFFGLSLFSVVANFTILGALTYSMTQWDGGLVDYPSMMKWVVIDPVTFTPVFFGAFALLAMVTRFSFAIFARRIAGPLTVGFLLSCSILLIPVRSSLAVCLIATATVFAALWLIKRFSRVTNFVLTRESKAALGLLLLPPSIMLIRALSLYQIDAVMVSCLTGLVYLSLRLWIRQLEAPNTLSKTLQITQYVTSLAFTAALIELIPYAGFALESLAFAAVLYLLVYDQIKGSHDASANAWILNVSVFLLVFSCLWSALIHPSLLPKFTSLFAAIGGFVLTQATRNCVAMNQIANLSVRAGLIGSTVLLVTRLLAVVNLSNWMLIGLLGVTLIIAASLYERFGLRLSRHS